MVDLAVKYRRKFGENRKREKTEFTYNFSSQKKATTANIKIKSF